MKLDLFRSPRIKILVAALALLMLGLPALAQDPGPMPAGPANAQNAAPNNPQEAPSTAAAPASPNAASAPSTPAKTAQIEVPSGTHLPLVLHNGISTRTAKPGDPVYFETIFPVMINGKVVIPAGSYVSGEVTESKRPGRVKGRGELYLRFDSLMLPNGVARDFRARVGGIDGQGGGEFEKKEGNIQSEDNRGGDAKTVAETAAAGTTIGLIAGAASKNLAMGGGIGAGAGAAAGLMIVLLTRGPDTVLAKGSTIEMVTDRPLQFAKNEVDFGTLHGGHFSAGGVSMPPAKNSSWSRWPI